MRELHPFATRPLLDIDGVLEWRGPSGQVRPLSEIIKAIQAADSLLENRPQPAHMDPASWEQQQTHSLGLLDSVYQRVVIIDSGLPHETDSFSNLAHIIALEAQARLDAAHQQYLLTSDEHFEHRDQLLNTLYDVCHVFDLAVDAGNVGPATLDQI